MSELNFKINSRAEILYEDTYYNCDIQDVKNGLIAISIPIKDNQYLPLRKEERVKVIYYDENCIYQFTSSVVERTKSNIPLIWLNQPKTYKKVQRRKYVRVPVLIDVRFALIRKDFKFDKSKLTSIKFENGTLLDISGGGAKLRTPLDIKKGDCFAIILPLQEGSMLVKGEVMRVAKDELGNKLCGVGFYDLRISEEDNIVKFVFAIMREQMKKGLKEEY